MFVAEGVEWWTKFMGRAPVSSLIGFNRGVKTVERTREWQEQIPNSRLLVLPGKSYHVAASDAVACAEATLEFMKQSIK